MSGIVIALNKEKQKKLWDIIAKQGTNKTTRGGWRNSYDGEPFSDEEMEEFSEDVLQKLIPYLDKEKTVALEVGCASGFTMYKIAPYCKQYIGTDLARINLEENEKYNSMHGINNIYLEQCEANEIDKFKDEDVSVIILNSVIQYFNTIDYLEDVINAALEIIKSDGIIYIGDIRDKEKKSEFETSVREYREKHDLPILPEREELFLSRYEVNELTMINPDRIIEVIVSDKIGKINNELKNYRFDAILKIH